MRIKNSNSRLYFLSHKPQSEVSVPPLRDYLLIIYMSRMIRNTVFFELFWRRLSIIYPGIFWAPLMCTARSLCSHARLGACHHEVYIPAGVTDILSKYMLNKLLNIYYIIHTMRSFSALRLNNKKPWPRLRKSWKGWIWAEIKAITGLLLT